jgi:para-nitrobenzyl esterase
MEIPFVFGTFGATGARELLGEPTAAMEALGRQIRDAWVAFAATGRPAGSGLPDWPGCEVHNAPTMVLDELCRVVDDPLAPAQTFWDGLTPLR